MNRLIEAVKKLAGAIKAAAVEHTRVMVIASCVTIAGAIGAGITVAGIVHRNNHLQVNAETINTTQEETIKLPTVTQAETTTWAEQPQEETVTEEETTSADIEEMIASGSVEIIAMENLEIVDASEAEVAQQEDVKTEIVDDTQVDTVPSTVYEVNELVRGIDVSQWQADIDWRAVADSGIKFAIIKCAGRGYGTGSLYEDPYFTKNIQGALANGIQVGVYFFSQATTVGEAYEEASMTVNLIKNYNITYPVAIDYETGSGYRINSVSMADKTKICKTFCDVVKSAGYSPMIYTCKSDFYNEIDTAQLAAGYKIWMAQYFYKYYGTGVDYQYGDDLPGFDWGYQMWQYTSTGTVPGISGNVDMNLAFFTYANYKPDNNHEAAIVVPSENVTLTEGDTYDLQNGVAAKNSIGYDAAYEYFVYDADGNEVESSDAYNRAGIYKVVYSFTDPKKGRIEKTVVITVIAKETETLPESETQKPTQEPTEKPSQKQTKK
ncbi:MAG: glycoside hydrolase family 25 protein [Eubacteriales bacterium]|nr:glycoside hydrolase family 25 protein [Eubacteriales bacterium]